MCFLFTYHCTGPMPMASRHESMDTLLPLHPGSISSLLEDGAKRCNSSALFMTANIRAGLAPDVLLSF
jgi:hypothetical protein